jgi:alkanesulfonate monooxygenase SsuD/methylene tetrahydromethanopterin reductase-like flavin-dependent oxidoreductase (luciferase family)
MRFSIMIEGQEGVSWADWQRLARKAEDGGFDALMRSDHYLTVGGGADTGALDAWGTINALAAITERIRLGTLVSPVTFRPAAVLAKLALTADHVSGGRVDVGMGTGWHEAEHEAFGLDLPPMQERFDQLEQQVHDVVGYWRDYGPRPIQDPHPYLVLGGQAKRRASALAAAHASEYNVVARDVDGVAEARANLDRACADAGRDPSTLTLSLMIQCAVGETQADVDARLERLGADRDGVLAGTPDEVIAQVRAYERAGLGRVMLQHLLVDDDAALDLLAAEVLPAFAG